MVPLEDAKAVNLLQLYCRIYRMFVYDILIKIICHVTKNTETEKRVPVWSGFEKNVLSLEIKLNIYLNTD